MDNYNLPPELSSVLPENRPPTNWPDFFERITYKPGVTFEAEYYIDRNEFIVHVDSMVEDSYHPGKKTRIHIAEALPNLPFELKLAKDMTRRLLGRLEDHERDEWLKFDGELVNDPHAHEKRQSLQSQMGDEKYKKELNQNGRYASEQTN